MSEAGARSKGGTFALVFGVAMGVLYLVADVADLPLFTYHPGTDRIDLGWTAPRKDEGPAMYWYGWIATSAIGAAIVAGIASLLPRGLASRIPYGLAWAVPLALVPLLLWSLRFYWRW